MNELEQVIKSHGGKEVYAEDVYGSMFKLGTGEIQRENEKGELKGNPIILGSWKNKITRRILFEDSFFDLLDEFNSADWAITNGVTYLGRANKAENQFRLYAFIIDLDGITPLTFSRFLIGANSDLIDGHGIYPLPNYVIMSGSNVHLYYLLSSPIDLFPKAKTELKKLKYGLIQCVWNGNTSKIEHPQYQGINQGFRIIGGKTKIGGVVRAFKLNKSSFSIEQLNEYVSDSDKADVSKFSKDSLSGLTLEEAEKKYPKWYEKVVVQGKRTNGIWQCSEKLYEWWLKKIHNYKLITYGHRYFCIMALAIFAAKSGITDKKRVKKDAMELLELFNLVKPDKPFTESDIDSALECLDPRYCTFPRKDIEKITAISIPPQKRNGRKQADHLRRARAMRDLNYPDGIWYRGNGRPKGSGTKQQLVLDYVAEHPNATKVQIAKDLGISYNTVSKWLKTADQDNKKD